MPNLLRLEDALWSDQLYMLPIERESLSQYLQRKHVIALRIRTRPQPLESCHSASTASRVFRVIRRECDQNTDPHEIARITHRFLAA